MPALRNIRHEHFIRTYLANGGNGADAYRKTSARYPWKETGMNNPNGFRVVAAVIRKRPEVWAREQELRAHMLKKSDITMEKVLNDLQEAYNIAKMNVKTGDMISATNSMAKLVGLLRDRVESGGVGDFDGMEVTSILQKVADEEGPAAALKLAQAFGLEVVEPEKAESDLIDQNPPSDAVN